MYACAGGFINLRLRRTDEFRRTDIKIHIARATCIIIIIIRSSARASKSNGFVRSKAPTRAPEGAARVPILEFQQGDSSNVVANEIYPVRS